MLWSNDLPENDRKPPGVYPELDESSLEVRFHPPPYARPPRRIVDTWQFRLGAIAAVVIVAGMLYRVLAPLIHR